MNLKLRLALKKDLTKLSKIYVEAYSKTAANEKWDNKTAKTMLTYWLKKQPDLFFVAELNSNLVGGFVSGIKPWWDGNHLFDGEIFVDPKYQKMGVGSDLIKAVFKKARAKYKAVVFEATTFKNQKFLLEWYKELGINTDKDLVFISGKINLD